MSDGQIYWVNYTDKIPPGVALQVYVTFIKLNQVY